MVWDQAWLFRKLHCRILAEYIKPHRESATKITKHLSFAALLIFGEQMYLVGTLHSDRSVAKYWYRGNQEKKPDVPISIFNCVALAKALCSSPSEFVYSPAWLRNEGTTSVLCHLPLKSLRPEGPKYPEARPAAGSKGLTIFSIRRRPHRY